MTPIANKHFTPDRRHLLLFSVSALTLAGCGGLGLGPANPDQTIYLLQPAMTAPPAQAAALGWALALDEPDASDSLDSHRIALVKADGTMDYYANATLPDRLPLLVQTALLTAFQTDGRIPVARTQDSLHVDYELTSEIRDFTAHYNQDDGGKPAGIPTVTVTLVSQMTTAHGRKIIASTTASQSVPASQNSTGAVVQAFNKALGAAVAQIVAWAATLPAPPPATVP